HTGDIEAAVKAEETVDKCMGEIVDFIIRAEGTAIITSDHGNCEEMFDKETLDTFTAHTVNRVPFIVVSKKNLNLKEGILADVAPTMLDLMGLKKPHDMTGNSLIEI
ncbi:MAG TPA: 2,3-bisphosphoglycerate-independent phosphoglycerate mutase, partial [Sedimentibacter sp.]|nr:2,3-bisphosphoglycerate-independent phosphoglycerate mutase [Sedimentibacter sp.]